MHLFSACYRRDNLSSLSLKQILAGRNLYLIGMMGSGKTVTGPPLAKKLGYGFVDSDVVIEQLASKSINQIFKDDGENTFRELETKVFQEISKHYQLVVSTGGGVVTRSENWGVLHQGVVVWIDPGRERLLARLQSDEKIRPLLKASDPLTALDQIIQDRQSFYNEADLRIAVTDESPEELALKITEQLPSIIDTSKLPTERHTIE